jgi:hypothetical protein
MDALTLVIRLATVLPELVKLVQDARQEIASSDAAKAKVAELVADVEAALEDIKKVLH